MRNSRSVEGGVGLSAITLAVLAGGRGKRMGLPKAWLQIGNKPILSELLARLEWPGPTMLVTTPEAVDPPGCELFDRKVTDPVDGLGPMRGLLTALVHLSTPMAAVVTVDMPCLMPAMLTWLVHALKDRPRCKGAMCRARDARSIEPFPSAFRAEAREIVARRLQAGQGSVRTLCEETGFLALDAPPEWPASVWTNLNYPSDLAAFEASRAEVTPTTKNEA